MYLIPGLYIGLVELFKKNKNELMWMNNYKKTYNISLSVISGILFFNVLYVQSQYGLHYLTCISPSPNLYFTKNIFCFLKIVEWSDTLFLILNNKKISWLHYVHHAIVPHMTIGVLDNTPGDNIVLMTNNLAHFMMYAYYAYPRQFSRVKIYITNYQTLQHVICCGMMIYHKFYKCDVNYPYFNCIAYFFFLIEFARLLLMQYKSKTN
jgi:hypothetical protein